MHFREHLEGKPEALFEVLALLADNCAGKSTLIKFISDALYAGESLLYDGVTDINSSRFTGEASTICQ